MDNLWQRRSNSSKLSLSTSNSTSNKEPFKTDSPVSFSSTKRFGGPTSSHGKSSPFNSVNTPTTPGGAGSSAFGLGSGAFASFGSSNKATKIPGGGGVAVGASSGAGAVASNANTEHQEKDSRKPSGDVKARTSSSSLAKSAVVAEHPIKNTWVVWYRPPASKYQDYEKSTIALASFSTAETFWEVYSHLRRPSSLPSVSDYHIFKKGVRPVWEDEQNREGGKWIVRLKKGVADRYWEDLLLGMVGDQFADAGDEICGAVLSVRSGEDVLAVWTRFDGGRNVKIRETIKRLLAFPADTNLIWKAHEHSIQQRKDLDEARQQKGSTGTVHTNRRRDTLSEEVTTEKTKPAS